MWGEGTAGSGEFVTHALAGGLPNTWAPHGNLAVKNVILTSWNDGLSYGPSNSDIISLFPLFF